MLNLQEVKDAVDHFSPDELRELREYLENHVVRFLTQQSLPAEERIRRLDEAASAIREDFTNREWDEIEKAMNEEYVESVDEDGFPLL